MSDIFQVERQATQNHQPAQLTKHKLKQIAINGKHTKQINNDEHTSYQLKKREKNKKERKQRTFE